MAVVVLAASALVLRVPMWVVAGTLAFSMLPPPAAFAVVLGAAGVSVLRSRKARDERGHDEGELPRQFSGRVLAGATFRGAIADPAMESVPLLARRLASLGRPMSEVGDALAPAFPINNAAFGAICAFSEHTGAAISTALTVLAQRADDAKELARQRGVALAQVKLSAVVVGLIPIAASVGLVALRGIPSPGGAIIVIPMIVGIALQITGTAVVFHVASRAT